MNSDSLQNLFEPAENEVIRIEHNEVLEKILSCVKPVNFHDLAFEKIADWKRELSDIEQNFGTDEAGNPQEIEDVELLKRVKELKKKISGCRLKDADFVVLIIETILNVSRENGLGICIQNGSVFLFNGEYWAEAPEEQIKPFLGTASEKMGHRKLDGKHYAFRDRLFNQFVSEGIRISTKYPPNTVLVNLQNGTFEITPNGGRLRKFRESDFLTHQLTFAFSKSAKAPIFHKYLEGVLPDQESRNILAEYIGYVFVKNSDMKLDKFLLLYGSGANGKSVFFEVINALLGKENVSNYSLYSLTNESGYQRAMIGTKLVNYASDISTKLEAAMLKALVSGEPVEARLPYGKPMVIENYAKLIFNLNELPGDVEQTEAFFRRFLIVPFNVTIEEQYQDKELSAKIARDPEELAGVFSWILEGLERLLAQKRFSHCKASADALLKYRTESDSVKMFFNDSGYQKATAENEFTLLKDVFSEYRQYCSENGYRVLTVQKLRKRLEGIGIESTKKSAGKVLFMVNPEADRF